MDLVKAVRDHALENYTTDGWDYVVECWSDEEISEEIQGATTAAEAIKRVRQIVKIQDSYRSDIMGTAW